MKQKPNLLLLHGAIGASSQLQGLASKLAQNYQVHTFDFSGHGGKEIPAESFSIEVFAEQVLKWTEEHEVEQIDIFGYSMGGYVALYLAKHYPQRVAKIFTLATKFKWTPEIALKEAGMMNPTKIEEKIPAFAQTLAQRHAPADWKTVLEKTAAMMLAMGQNNPLSAEDFSKIEQACTLSVGDSDKMVSLEETSEVCHHLKNASLLVLPKTAHPIEAVNLETLCAHLETFFS